MDYPQKTQTLDYYRQYASTFRTSNFVFWQHELEDFHSYLPEGRVLEVGCGVGVEAVLLADWYEYVGSDATQECIEVAQKANPNGAFKCIDLFDLGEVFTEKFDGFWCAATLLHVPKALMNQALVTIAGLLKPGAVGFISLKQGEGERMVELPGQEDQSRFFSFWQRNEFAAELRKAGFEVVDLVQKSTNSRVLPDVKEFWLGFFVQQVS